MSRPSGPRRRVYLIRHAQEDAEKRDGELQGPLTPIIHGFLVVEGLGSAKTPS